MNNLWESLTNCCAFLKLHCSEDGRSWIRLDLVSKIFSNDVIESYFSVLVNRCGGYKSYVRNFNQVAKNVDTMMQIQLSPGRRHETWVSKKKKYSPADVTRRALQKYNVGTDNVTYRGVELSEYYKTCKKRVLREIRGKQNTIRGYFKIEGNRMVG